MSGLSVPTPDSTGNRAEDATAAPPQALNTASFTSSDPSEPHGLAPVPHTAPVPPDNALSLRLNDHSQVLDVLLNRKPECRLQNKVLAHGMGTLGCLALVSCGECS